ncbi:DUF3048 domain-containing protein [Georgenia halophila]|uniref:DUF3048 domain-containing protein n=1 Tax=Georgenia halophila TaxID=620889 RepID=A0ABP8KYW0_9MICO
MISDARERGPADGEQHMTDGGPVDGLEAAGGPLLPRRAVTTALASAVALGLAGCTSSGRESTPVPRPTPSPTPSPTPTPTPTPEPRWPLTGAPLEGDLPGRPALSVKIENSAQARPQSGLEDADIVWEEMVEGGITRFSAVYHSVVPEVLGPIRSIRPMDAAIAAPVGGLLVFSGGLAPYVNRARDAGLQVISHDGGGSGFYRADHRRAPHNLYGSGEAFLDQATGSPSGPPDDLLHFAEESDDATAATDGDRAPSVDLSFPSANPGWTWQPDARSGRGVGPGCWRRSESGSLQSSEDGDPVLATNVVVLRVPVEMTGRRDVSGAAVPETILQGEGEGVVFSRGRAVDVAWAKGEAAEPLRITRGGDPVLLAPGITWIELLPISGSSISY